MAIHIGVAGNSARTRAWFDRGWFALFVILSALIVLACVQLLPPRAWWVWLLMPPAAIAGLWPQRAFVFELYRDFRGADRWEKGADGESMVANALNALPDDFAVVHDFHPLAATGGRAAWNVDHIIIGPTGVFVVDAKNYGRERVRPGASDPTTKKNVAQAKRNAVELKERLVTWSAGKLADIFVEPVVVYVQPGAFVEKTREGSARVIPLKWLAGDVLDKPAQALDLDQIYRITFALWSQMEPYLRDASRSELARLGARSRAFKLERADQAHQAKREARAAGVATGSATVPPVATHVLPDSSERSRVCPSCGGRLIERTARRGPHAGKPFLGCENFAKRGCHYITRLEPSG